ncbi:GntR family transcriptional regulator [Lentisphaerota bacterium ZTH]|nr:GntR family transcriptional regulator [Lentisphaerota bacterium ZTH]
MDSKKIPIYKQIYLDLKSNIVSGDYPQGKLIPAERELKKKYGVSHITVRNALSMLVRENFIRREPGIGTVVTWSGSGAPHKVKPLESISIIVEKGDNSLSELLNLIEIDCMRNNLFLKIFCHRRDYSVLKSQYERAAEDKNTLIVLFPPGPQCSWLNFHEALSRTIIIDELIPGLAAPQIISQDEVGFYELVKYLLTLGHRHIAYIGAASRTSGYLRHQGYLKALKEAGIPARAEYIGNGSYDAGISCSVFKQIIEKCPELTACCCANDYSAFGVFKHLDSMGIVPGKGFALTGYGNYEISDYLGLTSVSQRSDLIVKHLFSLLEEYEQSGSLNAGIWPVPTELKIRSSVSAAR